MKDRAGHRPKPTFVNTERAITEIARRVGVPRERVAGRHRDRGAVRAKHLSLWMLHAAGLTMRAASLRLGMAGNAMGEALSVILARADLHSLAGPVIDVATGKGSLEVACALVRETFDGVTLDDREALAAYLTGVCAQGPQDAAGARGLLLLGGDAALRWRVFAALYASSMEGWIPTIRQQVRVYGRKVAA